MFIEHNFEQIRAMMTYAHEHSEAERRQGEGEGGFACVAGSHNLSRRHQFPWPRRPPWPEESGVRTVPCRAGDCLIFTEEMTHATAPYKGKHGRTTLFLKSDPRP